MRMIFISAANRISSRAREATRSAMGLLARAGGSRAARWRRRFLFDGSGLRWPSSGSASLRPACSFLISCRAASLIDPAAASRSYGELCRHP